LRQIFGTPARSGPESDFVLDFLYNLDTVNANGLSESIFIEYRLENSTPDVIVVQWDPKITKLWASSRAHLKNVDYRLIHLLYVRGALSTQQLTLFFPTKLSSMLKRLSQAEIVVEHDQTWQLNSLDSIFAVRKIVSIEAKLSNSMRAVEQALLNTLFSSESYVLTKSVNPLKKSIKAAHDRGVGVWSYSNGRLNELVDAKEQTLPQSHVSWMLNDMAWQYTLGKKSELRS